MGHLPLFILFNDDLCITVREQCRLLVFEENI